MLLSNLFLLLNACNPNSSQITIYTTDFDEVKKGEIVDIPMKLSFQMIGEDEDNSLEKSKNIAIKFLHPDSKFYITKGQYTKDFVVETFAAPVYPLYATTPTAARMPMMATTTRSSIRVKAFCFIY